jgi:uncharacterized RDD family membrane protein YckC
MGDDQPTRLPVDRADADRATAVQSASLREVRPAVCPDCDAAVPGGAHFCPSCHVFLADRWVGSLATPKRRLAAAVLDGIFKDGGLFGMAIWNAVLPHGFATTVVRIMSMIYGVSALVFWSRGTTPAKRLLDVKVVTEDGEPAGFWRMAFRETIGKWISTVVFGLGLLAIPRDRERQGWHDRMAGTWVVHDEDE